MPVHLRPLRLHAVALAFASQLLPACGDSTANTSAVPQVAGTYSLTEAVPAATCDPNQLPAGGIVRLDAFSLAYDVVIEQEGAQISLHEGGISDNPEVGSIAADSSISLDGHLAFEETPREGDRVFFVDLTITRELKLQPGSPITGTASYVNVFREGSADAAVYTTCSRQGGTLQLVRR